MFIEGDTERILLPAMMKKLDQEDAQREVISGADPSLPLLSQNVSIIEVGAYAKIFEKFLDFIGVKSLVVTDIDSVKSVPKKDSKGNVQKTADGKEKTKYETCPVAEGEKTSNPSLKFFYGDASTFDKLLGLKLGEKILRKSTKTGAWERCEDGNLLCVFQTKQTVDKVEFHARSFEDAFFQVNKSFISACAFDDSGSFVGSDTFPSLVQKKMRRFANSEIDAFEMADGVKKKPPFATEILLNSESEKVSLKDKNTERTIVMNLEFSNWVIPDYIKEGLQWLKQDQP